MQLQQVLTSALKSSGGSNVLKQDDNDYKSVFLSRVVPDQSNPRFLPAVVISDLHAQQFVKKHISKSQLIERYDAAGKVIIGKSCIINTFERKSNDWKLANISIESIIELSENIAVSEMIQVPTLYPIHDGNYQILTGHRRFFALIYIYGSEGAAHFKIYRSKPLLKKIKQFQENASREDLPQYGKLKAFQDAMLEMDTLNVSRKILGLKAITVREIASTLGISMGSFDNYNVLTRYPCVTDLYEKGFSEAFTKTKKLVLKVETSYRRKNNINVLNVEDKKKINSLVEKYLSGDKTAIKNLVERKVNFRLQEITSVEAVKKLLTTNIMEIDTGVDWEHLNWDDRKTVNKALEKVVEFLTKI